MQIAVFNFFIHHAMTWLWLSYHASSLELKKSSNASHINGLYFYCFCPVASWRVFKLYISFRLIHGFSIYKSNRQEKYWLQLYGCWLRCQWLLRLHQTPPRARRSLLGLLLRKDRLQKAKLVPSTRLGARANFRGTKKNGLSSLHINIGRNLVRY